MISQNKGDVVAALVLIVFAAYVIYVAAGLPYVSEFGPGPGFLPLWLGIGMILLALPLAWMNLPAFIKESGMEKKASAWRGSGRALSAWLVFSLSIVFLSKLGFVLSLVLMSLILIRFIDRQSLWIALAVSVALGLGFHYIFNIALGVSLPTGPLGF